MQDWMVLHTTQCIYEMVVSTCICIKLRPVFQVIEDTDRKKSHGMNKNEINVHFFISVVPITHIHSTLFP